VGLRLELCLELGVAGLLDQLDEGEQLVSAIEQALPQVDVGPQPVRFAQDGLGGGLIVPEPGFLGQLLELRDASGPAGEVKAAPRSTGSVRPGRE